MECLRRILGNWFLIQFTEPNNIKHNFNREAAMAWKAWATAFRKHYPELKSRNFLTFWKK